MIRFDVKCEVLHPITLADSAGNEVTVPDGMYHLIGLDHLVRAAGEGVAAAGMDLELVSVGDRKTVYAVSAEALAGYISRDDVEITV